jgi:uncharacterized membrane protein
MMKILLMQMIRVIVVGYLFERNMIAVVVVVVVVAAAAAAAADVTGAAAATADQMIMCEMNLSWIVHAYWTRYRMIETIFIVATF